MPTLIFPPLVASLAAAFTGPLLGPCRWPVLHLHFHGGLAQQRLLAICLTASAAGVGVEQITRLANMKPATGPATPRWLFDTVSLVSEPTRAIGSQQYGKKSQEQLPDADVTQAGLLIGLEVAGWQRMLVSAGEEAVAARQREGTGIDAENESTVLNLPMSRDAWRARRQRGLAKMSFRWTLETFAAQSDISYQKYARFLADSGRDLSKTARSSATEFRRARQIAEPELTRSPLLTKFAHLYAGGAMAIAARALPLTLADLNSALGACLNVARRAAREVVVTDLALQRQLHRHLQSTSIARGRASGAFGPGDKAGFQRSDDGERIYIVHAKAFGSWFASGAERASVLRWLHEARHLRIGGGQFRGSALSTGWAARVVQWPDGRWHRCYVFRDPFGA